MEGHQASPFSSSLKGPDGGTFMSVSQADKVHVGITTLEGKVLNFTDEPGSHLKFARQLVGDFNLVTFISLGVFPRFRKNHTVGCDLHHRKFLNRRAKTRESNTAIAHVLKFALHDQAIDEFRDAGVMLWLLGFEMHKQIYDAQGGTKTFEHGNKVLFLGGFPREFFGRVFKSHFLSLAMRAGYEEDFFFGGDFEVVLGAVFFFAPKERAVFGLLAASRSSSRARPKETVRTSSSFLREVKVLWCLI